MKHAISHPMTRAVTRQPSLFISHGAPSYAVEPGIAGPRLTALGRALPKPEAVLLVSPHWMTRDVRVSTTAQPETIYDFGGFDPALNKIKYPAPGHPVLAARAIEVLRENGWQVEADPDRGLDHGAWVPLLHLYPKADVPVFQVSLPAKLDGESAYAFGRALAPLAEEGVLIVGSGSLTHNLYEALGGSAGDVEYAKAFAQWIQAVAIRGDHESLRQALMLAPHAKRAHPTAEHYWPMVVAAGAAASSNTASSQSATVLQGGFTYGVLAMDSFMFGGLGEEARL